MQNLRQTILNAYIDARLHGKTDDEAAQAAWMAVRAHPSGRKLRAPRWDEALDHNGGSKRSYKVPLGVAWCVANGTPASGWRGLGSHAGNWPRTVQSVSSIYRARVQLVDILEDAAGCQVVRVAEERDESSCALSASRAWMAREPRVVLTAEQMLERMKVEAEKGAVCGRCLHPEHPGRGCAGLEADPREAPTLTFEGAVADALGVTGAVYLKEEREAAKATPFVRSLAGLGVDIDALLDS